MASLPTKTQEHGKGSLQIVAALLPNTMAQNSATPPLS